MIHNPPSIILIPLPFKTTQGPYPSYELGDRYPNPT